MPVKIELNKNASSGVKPVKIYTNDIEQSAPTKAVKQQKRNGHAFHPIMAKGGVHEKSKGAQRAAAKRQTSQKAREWLGRS